MTTERKVHANRQNAKCSSGPKSSDGKKRAAQNARRHGLSVPPLASEDDAVWIKRMVDATCGVDADADIRGLVQEIFYAQSTLLRVRGARKQLFSRVLNDPDFLSKKERKMSSILASVEAQIGPIKIPDLLKPLFEKSQREDRYAIILKDFASQLETMERYENRALSKRRKAIGNYFTHIYSRTSNAQPAFEANCKPTSEVVF
jgi:hypothetical protein